MSKQKFKTESDDKAREIKKVGTESIPNEFTGGC